MKKKKREAFGGEERRGRHRRSRGIFCLSSSLHLSETHRGKHCSCRGTIHLGTSKRCPDVQNWHTHNQLSLNNSTHRNTLMAGKKITRLTWNSHCTWHVPPIPICSHITLATAAVQLSHIICCFLAFLVLLCQKINKKTKVLFLSWGSFAFVGPCKTKIVQQSQVPAHKVPALCVSCCTVGSGLLH